MANISKRGDKWRAEVCIDRVRKAKSFPTKREAIEWSLTMERTGVVPTRTLRELITRYRPIAEAHRGAQAELSRLDTLERNLGSLTLETLTSSRIAKYRDDRLKEVGPSSVRREMIILSAMFKIAVQEWQWATHSPLLTVNKPSSPPARRRGISEDEITQILSNLKKSRLGAQVSAMFLLSIETGMRLGEIVGLRWENVSEKVVTLPKTKNGDSRQVPLSLKAREILQSRRGMDDEMVFTIASNAASQVFRRASINDVHLHDARGEAVTRLSKRLDVMQLAKMIGHRDPRSLMFYYAEKPEDIADSLG